MKITLFSIFICMLAVPVYAEMVSIKGEDVNLRNGPGKNYSVEWKYGKGFPVKVVKKQKDWVKITDFEGESGWVFHTLVEKKRNIIINTGKNNNIKVAIRATPEVNAPSIAFAFHGVIFTLVQQQGNWLEVQHKTGIKGWVEKKFAWGY